MSTSPLRRRPRRRMAFLLLAAVAAAGAGVPLGVEYQRSEAVAPAPRPSPLAADLADLSNAIPTFKAKMRVEYIPAFGDTARNAHPQCRFRLRPAYPPGPSDRPDAPDDQSAEALYLKSLFPQLDLGNTGLPKADLDPNQALVFFLTGGLVTGHKGFSADKRRPFAPPQAAGEPRVGPFLDLAGAPERTDAEGHYVDPWGAPYAYFAWEAPLKGYPDSAGASWPAGVTAYRQGGTFLHPRGFQIISAGPDRVFGPGGEWTPGQGP